MLVRVGEAEPFTEGLKAREVALGLPEKLLAESRVMLPVGWAATETVALAIDTRPCGGSMFVAAEMLTGTVKTASRHEIETKLAADSV